MTQAPPQPSTESPKDPPSAPTQGEKPAKPLSDLPIVPEAEPRGHSSALVTSADEKAYFDADRAAHELAQRRLEMGWLGKVFGTWWTPALIIAATLALLIVALWLATLLSSSSDMPEARKYLFTGLMSVIAYIFGAASKGSRQE